MTYLFFSLLTTMRNLSFISTTLLGLMFLVSAFAKAWDGEAFADMLLLYGPQWFSIGAPVIIMIEAVLGMFLLLRVHPRITAVAADAFLIVVSAIFAYGTLALGIEDCGCFGALSRLYTGKPWMTFARNGVFLLISVPAWIYPAKDYENHQLPKLIASLITASAACFICGLAMHRTFDLPDISSTKFDTRNQTMEKLCNIYPFSSDSTYVVYLFSFSCVHCQNSFANVQQFEQLHLADKVLGIAMDDAEAQERFYRIYQPQISIMSIPHDTMTQITGQLPVLLLIKDNRIESVESGSVTSPGIFLE